MHSHMLWRTAAAAMSTGALCALVACGGGDKNNQGKSTTPESQAAQMPSQTQTTSSTYAEPSSTAGTTSTTGSSTSGTDTTGSSGMMGGSQGSMGMGSTGTPGSTGSMGSMGSMGSTGSMMGGTGGTPMSADLANLTDEQILAVAVAASHVAAQQAQIVKERSQNAQVKRFAERVVADEQAISRSTQKLITKMKVTPMQNAASQRLTNDGTQVMTSLKGERGGAFDRDYIDAQIRDQRQLLDALDNHLIPQARNADLKKELQTVRDKVQTHLNDAVDIQKILPATP